MPEGLESVFWAFFVAPGLSLKHIILVSNDIIIYF